MGEPGASQSRSTVQFEPHHRVELLASFHNLLPFPIAELLSEAPLVSRSAETIETEAL